MSTATTPAELVREVVATLAAARAAEPLLARFPDLPVARMHAEGTDHLGHGLPLLEVQLDHDVDALTTWARTVHADVHVRPFMGGSEHTAAVTLAGPTGRVLVLASAYQDTDPDDFEGRFLTVFGEAA
jgi:hypothetical protein